MHQPSLSSTFDKYSKCTRKEIFLDISNSGARVNSTTSSPEYPGLVSYNYQVPALDSRGVPTGAYRTARTKTTYDPTIISDQQMVSMQMTAAQKGADAFASLPLTTREIEVKVNGYWFNVTRDNTNTITNAFPIIPK